MMNGRQLALAAFVAVLSLTANAVRAQQTEQKPSLSAPDCALHHKHTEELNRRGDEGMGFSQAKTTHHFLLTRDGGAIRVDANDANDEASRQQVRRHLLGISRMFADGDFDVPMFVHDGVPPGVTALRRLKGAIKYRFEETAQGGRVRISSENAEAVAAVHEFLRFQIREHETGDPTQISVK